MTKSIFSINRNYFFGMVVCWMLYFLDHTPKLRNFPDNIFIATFDIFDIGDRRLSSCDHCREDHCHSGSEIPTRDRGSLQEGFSENQCFMRIHDGDMSLHFLDLDEPIEPTFEEYLMNP